MTGDELVKAGLSFLLGVMVTGGYNLYTRLVEKKINEKRRQKALAYTYVVQLTEFEAFDASIRGMVERSSPALAEVANGESLLYTFAIEWEGHLRGMNEGEQEAQVALLKPLIRMVEDYMADFQLSPDKLADFPQDVIYFYNLHQMEGRRLAVSASSLLDDITERKEQLSADAILRALASFKAYIVAVKALSEKFVAIAELSKDEVQTMFERSLERQMSAIQDGQRDVEEVKNLRARRESLEAQLANAA